MKKVAMSTFVVDQTTISKNLKKDLKKDLHYMRKDYTKLGL